MNELEPTSDSEADDPNNITDAASCLDFLKRREVFLYKMMNDPSHKAMLYFLEVLMNSDTPVTVEQLAARFSHKIFSQEMREACGGGSAEGLREFLQRYPALFNVHANGEVTSVAVDLPNLGTDSVVDGCSSNQSVGSDFLDSKSNHIHRTKKDQKSNRWTTDMSTTDSNGKYKFKSASTLSLISSRSNNSLNSSFESHSTSFADQNAARRCENAPTGDRIRSNAAATNTNLHRRISNPTVSMWPGSSGVYQPPQLREQARMSNLGTGSTCEHCTPAESNVNAATGCMHCPLLSLTCHHCTMASHHHHHHHLHPTSCCHLDTNAHCHSICNAATAQRAVTNPCALPPLEKLILETEAVKFFQQRLLKRDERWIPIKSLAGHLSQASAEIRAIVGPQLEFRRFLLKHPHVFEVQGELVSVKDAFSTFGVQRRTHDNRFGLTHSTQSISNLSSIPLRNRADRTPVARPKSMILTSSQYVNPLTFNGESGVRKLGEHRRSTHFADNVVTASYTVPSGSGSAPTTPTGSNPPSVSMATKAMDSSSGMISSSTEITESANTQTSFDSSKRLNSLTISMSVNEYKAIMYLRKVLQKPVGTVDQSHGLTLNELMQLISTKAPELVQNTIGWTKVELQEFLSQHTIFFELDGTNQATMADGSHTIVKNKRLQRMINIVITGTKPMESTVRTLTNRCGRIFHVAKLWGIIDLGKHEHVFFDKSIFKHVDDLQRYFKVNELLYFNAILAPKESRAKWRATQVWKECDRENVEKFGFKSSTSSSKMASVDGGRISDDSRQSVRSKNSGEQDSSSLALNEDTEADEDIEDFEVEMNSRLDELIAGADRMNSYSHSANESVEGEMHDEEVAREEGLHLAKDIRFITDDMEDDYSDAQLSSTSSQTEFKSNNNNVVTSTSNKASDNKFSHMTTKNVSTEISSVNKGQECVTSSTESTNNKKLEIPNFNKCPNNCETAAVSIAVQTLSTGDIMATQLYHDQSKR